jgi:protein required for attachment to host cells
MQKFDFDQGAFRLFGLALDEVIKEMAMLERPTLRQPIKITWILVADGRSVQAYELRKSRRIRSLTGSQKHPAIEEIDEHELVPVLKVEAEPLDDFEIGHDRRGETMSSANNAHNAYEPSNIEEELMRKYMDEVSVKLHHAYIDKQFANLILVAPAKMMGALRQQLTPDVKQSIVAQVRKDLAGYEAKKIVAHLQETFREAKVA